MCNHLDEGEPARHGLHRMVVIGDRDERAGDIVATEAEAHARTAVLCIDLFPRLTRNNLHAEQDTEGSAVAPGRGLRGQGERRGQDWQ